MEAIQPLIGMSKPARRYISARAAGEALLALVALGCAAALFASRSASAPRAAPLATPAGDYCISPLCLHALGGGASRSGGDFPHIDPDGCKAQLSAYITSGAYMAEVNASIASAFDALGLARTGAASRGAASGGAGSAAAGGGAGGSVRGSKIQVFVFDIDETALSNIVEWQQPGPSGGGSSSTNSASLSAGAPLARLARGSPAEWDAQLASAANDSPALAPTLKFYKALCAAGYSVAFVTGRGESARALTRANLASAGYGDRCPNATAPAAGASAAGAAVAGDESPCCYADLMLRPPGDVRLASVYKPWARAQLKAKGYELFGSIGDQFSDLNGENDAANSFKLPNPFYYIL